MLVYVSVCMLMCIVTWVGKTHGERTRVGGKMDGKRDINAAQVERERK